MSDALFTKEGQPGPSGWIKPEGYYEAIATSDVNAGLHEFGRGVVHKLVVARFGEIVVDVAPGVDTSKFAAGNIIVASVHRDEIDTVTVPLATEAVGIHHARPISKAELFKNRWSAALMHGLGAFAIDREDPDEEGLMIAQKGILERNGVITNYGENTRVHQNVLNVGRVNAAVVTVAADCGSLVVPLGIAGLSSERTKGKPSHTLSRDKRAYFGKGPRLVFSFGEPLRIEPLPPVDETKEGMAAQKNRLKAIRAGQEKVRLAMEKAHHRAYDIRGSSLEKKYKTTRHQ